MSSLRLSHPPPQVAPRAGRWERHFIDRGRATRRALSRPDPNAGQEEFRRAGVADFSLRDGTLPIGTILGLLADHLESLWGGPNPVSRTLWDRGYALYREWWDKRLREHEAAVWRIRNGVE